MTLAMFLVLLSIGASGSALLTEAVKKWCVNSNRDYSANGIAFANSVVFGVGLGVVAYLVFSVPFTFLNIVLLAPLSFCNWIGCMIGYDKVMQWITQIKEKNENG